MMWRRILSFDPIRRGLAYVVVERGQLIDWGIVVVHPPDSKKTLKRFTDLARRMQPALIVMEDCAVPSCRRTPRVRNLIQEIRERATDLAIRVRCVEVRSIERDFARAGIRTKTE